MALENISSEQFWISGIITAIIDLIFILVLVWRIKPTCFLELKWTLVSTAAICWGLFSIFLMFVFWNTYYGHFFPSWFRAGGILLFVPIVYGFFALIFHSLASRLPGNPLVVFCLFGGVESLFEHILGIYSFKILEIPLLKEASPAAILAFSFPEYILYWCIIISIAALVQKAYKKLIPN